MRSGKKSDLLQNLEDLIPHHNDFDNPPVELDMVIIDGAAAVNMIQPGTSETFLDYAHELMNYTRRHFTGLVRRTDIVFDVYRSDSLKADTRKKRGKGIRIRAEAHRKLLGNWQQFLREDGNKSELFDPLCHQLAQEQFPGVVIMTNGEDVCKSKAVDTEILSPCTQEEADTRMLLHAADDVKQGHKNILLRTVDTDVVVLAVNLAHKLECDRLNIAFGTG